MNINVIFLITTFVFSLSVFADEIFLTKITHSESDTIRHLTLITDHLGNLSDFKITEFEEHDTLYNVISFDELTYAPFEPPAPFSKFASIDAQSLTKSDGGRIILTYSPNIFTSQKHTMEFDLLKENNTWVLYDTNIQPIFHLELIINKKARVPVGIKELIINP